MATQNRKGDNGVYYFYSASGQLAKIISAYDTIAKAFEFLTERLEELENAQQDLLHYIEFTDLNIQKGYKIYKQLQEVRIERRLVKDELEAMAIANESLKSIKEGMYGIRKGQSATSKLEFNTTKFYKPRNPKETGITDFDVSQEKYHQKLETMVNVRK